MRCNETCARCRFVFVVRHGRVFKGHRVVVVVVVVTLMEFIYDVLL